MIKSILAGFMICLAAALYLTVGGPLGAFMFSIGLFTILCFQFNLFTGKAGLLVTREIEWWRLGSIWLGNFIGVFAAASLIAAISLGASIIGPAAAITAVRIGNLWYQNIILGFFCGLLMYISVKAYPNASYITALGVASFILFGANHCIADMAYLCLSWTLDKLVPGLIALACTTVGNLIGCCTIPIAQRLNFSN